MATTLNAGTVSGGAAIAADTTGILALQSGSSPTTAVTIDTSQNVGIGTSSPAQKLDVASKVQIDTANSYGKIKIARATDSGINALYIQGADNAGTGNELSIVNSGGGGAAINVTGGELKFFASSNTTERMRINSSGDVFINSTSYPVVGTEKFGVNGGTNIAGAFTTNSSSNPTTWINSSPNGSVTFVRFS